MAGRGGKMSALAECLVALLGVINFITMVYLLTISLVDSDGIEFISYRQLLWETLDDININFLGKLIVYILSLPFTLLYIIVALVYKIGRFIIINIFKLFCLLFQKKS